MDREKAYITWRQSEEPGRGDSPWSLGIGRSPCRAVPSPPEPRESGAKHSHLLPCAMIGVEALPVLLCLYLARDVSYNFHKD